MDRALPRVEGSIGPRVTVHRLLTSPAYMGQATYNRYESVEPARPRCPGAYRKHAKSSRRRRARAQWLTVPIPAIIDAETHDRVRATFARHKTFARRNAQHDYLLRGLVVCGACGRRMQALRQWRPPHYEYFLYGCGRLDTTATGRAERRRSRRVRQVDLEAAVALPRRRPGCLRPAMSAPATPPSRVPDSGPSDPGSPLRPFFLALSTGNHTAATPTAATRANWRSIPRPARSRSSPIRRWTIS